MKLVILEGLNGSGKTSVAQVVAKELGWQESRLPYYENNSGKIIRKHIDEGKENITEVAFQALMLENYIETAKEWIEKGDDIIITRGGLSMTVYGNYFDPYFSDMYRCYNVMWNRFLNDNDIDVQQILIDVPVDVAQSRIWSRGDKIEIFENKEVESFAYNKFQEFARDGILEKVDNSGDICYTVKELCNLIK